MAVKLAKANPEAVAQNTAMAEEVGRVMEAVERRIQR